MAAVLLIAGAVEGAVLGAAQAHVLRRMLPTLRRGRFVAATAVAAVVAHALGLTPSVLADRLDDVSRRSRRGRGCRASVVHEGRSTGAALVIGVAAGLLVAAAITGMAAVRRVAPVKPLPR